MPVRTNVETVKLQLAMAFGQGAGSLLAEGDAIKRLLADSGPLLAIAVKDWEQYQVPFVHHVRLLGQHSAMRAGAAGHAVIGWRDIRDSMGPALLGCPCYRRTRPRTPR